MATNTAAAKTEKPAKKTITLVERMKSQLNTAALKGKLTSAELQELQAHLTKIAGLIG